MSLLVLSLGSNIERRKNILFALQKLRELFGGLRESPVYQSCAVGFEGPDFYNMVVAVNTLMDLEEIVRALRDIEQQAGRVRGEKSFESRRLDIDVLLYGDANLRNQGWDIPRTEIDHAAYVLKPLADLLPEMRHPVSQKRFVELWENFTEASQRLEAVEFNTNVC